MLKAYAINPETYTFAYSALELYFRTYILKNAKKLDNNEKLR